MKTYVYVDAFNLYFGAVRGTPYRWLDLAAFCRILLPAHHIDRIKYFTAIVHSRPSDPAQPDRQRTYLAQYSLGISLGRLMLSTPLCEHQGSSPPSRE